jgi:hypothetical protein
MTSQSPFTSQGLLLMQNLDKQVKSWQVIMITLITEIRMAHAFSPKLAGKANFTYMRGTDWYATNYDDPLKRQESCEL